MDDLLTMPTASGYGPPPYLTPERILEFQRVMEKCYGVSIGYQAASERAARLIALYRAIIGPIPEASPESSAP